MSLFALELICYSPKVYSGFDKFNLLLAGKMIKKGVIPVFVFYDTMKWQPTIQSDLERLGAVVELIPSKNHRKQFVAIYRLYQKYHPIFVHAHFANYVKLIACFLSFCFGNKHFTTFHSMIYDDTYTVYMKKKGWLKSCLLRFFFRILEKKSEKLFVISKLIGRQLTEFLGRTSLKIHTLYLGVNTKVSMKTKQDVRNELGISNNAVVLLNISAKEHIKGIDLLLQALAKLLARFPEKKIILLHAGGLRSDTKYNKDYESYLYNMTKQLQLENNVMWLGIRNDIADIMPAVDIYVHPSLQEGLGMVNMEAAVESVPLVGSNVGGIPEIIQNGKNGFLFQVGNVEDLANKIAVLIDEKILRMKMGNCSREILLKEFDVNNQSDKLLNFYMQ